MPLFYIPGYEKKHSLWCLCIISVVILKVFTFIISEPYRKAVFLHGVHVIPLLHWLHYEKNEKSSTCQRTDDRKADNHKMKNRKSAL